MHNYIYATEEGIICTMAYASKEKLVREVLFYIEGNINNETETSKKGYAEIAFAINAIKNNNVDEAIKWWNQYYNSVYGTVTAHRIEQINFV